MGQFVGPGEVSPQLIDPRADFELTVSWKGKSISHIVAHVCVSVCLYFCFYVCVCVYVYFFFVPVSSFTYYFLQVDQNWGKFTKERMLKRQSTTKKALSTWKTVSYNHFS